jgi:hypothetical protein
MSRLTGIKFEKDTAGRVRKVVLDMKYHAQFVQDYLDHLKIEEAKKNGEFVAWEDVKVQLDKKHGIDSKKLQSHPGAQSRKRA